MDILVNNAGIMFTKRVAEVTEADFDRIFAVNVKGTFFTCQQAATRLADGGRIINLSSSVTGRLMPTYGAYAATKGAVEQLTRSLAGELGPRGITVNAVSPGPTETDLFGSNKSEEEIQRFARLSTFNRLGQPDDIAERGHFSGQQCGKMDYWPKYPRKRWSHLNRLLAKPRVTQV